MPDPIRIGVAAGIAALVSFAATLAVGRWPRPALGSAALALATLGAAWIGLWMLGLLPHVPPREDLDRLLLIVLPLAVVVELAATLRPRWAWIARGAAATAVAPILLHGSVYVSNLSGPGTRLWSIPEMAAIFAALACVLLAAWALMHRLADRDNSALALVAAATLGAGVSLLLSGYASGGQVGLMLACALGGVGFGVQLGPANFAKQAALGLGVVSLFSLVVVGNRFADLSLLGGGLLFVAPLLGWLPERLPKRRGLRTTLRWAATLTPVLIALVLAQQKFAAKSAGDPSESGAPASSLDDYLQFGN